MPTPREYAQMERLRQLTGKRIRLRPWESVLQYDETDTSIKVRIETFDVQVLVREDRYKSRSIRGIFFHRKTIDAAWVELFDEMLPDEDFVPYVFEKVGRRKTADEMIEQREFEKMCHRPGTAKNPLDSYERVLGGYTTKRMEGHY